MKRKTIELAECLKSVGVQKGDVIGLCSENRLEFPVPLFAAFCLGITVAPLNLTYTEREYLAFITMLNLFFLLDFALQNKR